MACSKLFSFAEVVQGRDASVRVTDDNLLYAVDLVMVMTGLARDQSGLALRRLSDDNSHSINMIERQLSTHGGPKTKLVSFRDALQLVMVLPGKVAKETRAQFASIIQRYLAGDKTLHAEIEQNSESSSPVAQLARASIEGDGENPLKRRKIHDAEVAKMELENARMAAENQQLAITNQKMAYELYAMACHDGKPDDRIRMLFKDNMYNLMAPPASSTTGAKALAITNGGLESMAHRPITISTVATELGLKFTSDELKRIGGLVRKRYMQRHGEPPGKHEQLVGGSVRHVNSYTAKDKDLVEAVLREWHDDAGDDA
jgi:hypothetical protein